MHILYCSLERKLRGLSCIQNAHGKKKKGGGEDIKWIIRSRKWKDR
jgi:hypothetical protein